MSLIQGNLQLAREAFTESRQAGVSNQKMPENVEAIKKLSEEFEAIFLEIMLKSMRDSVQKSELVDGGNGEEIFRSMLDSEYAKSIASQRTTGLAEAIENHLVGLMTEPEKLDGLEKYKASQLK